MSKNQYDFGGYVTRNDLKCSDGRVIRHGAFKECDGQTVPLVWGHRHDDPEKVLGHVLLENRDDGVYGYGSFNDLEAGRIAHGLVQHGDVASLSIYANKLVQRGQDVIHGAIREVSLVLAGANPGARIENVVIAHSDGFEDYLDDEAVVSIGEPLELAHADSGSDGKSGASDEGSGDGKTIAEIFDTLTEEQSEAVFAVIGSMLAEGGEDDEGDEVKHADLDTDGFMAVYEGMTDDQKQLVDILVGYSLENGDAASHSAIDDYQNTYEEGTSEMKHNVFDEESGTTTVLKHSDMETIIKNAKASGSLAEATADFLEVDVDSLKHGIVDIEMLFPEAQMVGGTTPGFIQRRMEWVSSVMNGVHKSPFARVKSNAANITMDEARARGYIKGNQKVEEQFTLLKRTTDPQTVYKLQKLDRDDIIDITDFDVVAFMKGEMRMMLDEELARAFMVGDGRSAASDDKIHEAHIRPIWTDDEVYAVHTVLAKTTPVPDIIDEIIKSKKQYRGSGRPIMYIGTDLLTEMRLLKDGDGKRLYKNDQELADDLRVSGIVEVELFDGLTRQVNGVTRELGCIIVNLADYNVGANKGGEVSMFDDFDLNFNKYEYLIETRVSGALYQPKSALVLEFAQTGLRNVYEEVPSSETGVTGVDPSAEGWYQKDGIIYVHTNDKAVVDGKKYYRLA